MIRRFEDLIAWQKARGLTKRVYLATREGPSARDFRFTDQIRSAGVSVMANIAEGFERGGLGEFHQYLSTAKASCAELRSHLYVALDVGYLDEESFRSIMCDAEEVGRVVGGLRAAVQQQRDSKRSG
jgi:four helix bundle protein